MDEELDYIVADNEVETATPLDTETKELPQNETEVTAEPTEKIEVKEPTETQRVSQRINEAKQQAKDEVIAEMGYEWNGQPITTEKAYKEALAEQKEQQRVTALEEKGIDTKAMDEAINSNPTVKQAKELLAKQSKLDSDWKDFVSVKEEFGIKSPDEIPKEALEHKDKTGKSLYDSMIWNENRVMKEKLKVYEQNEKVGKKSPMGSITAHGSEEVAETDDFLKGFNSY